MTETATETAVARLPDFGQLELAFELPEGTLHPNGLQLTNPDMTFDSWTQIMHRIGAFARWSRFALGDALLFGEAVFGEDSAQAVEGTAAERYDVAQRVTGLQVATLQNYASLCARIPIPVRRIELDFSTHEPVAALERDEQVYWLEQAVVNGWDRGALRQAIKDAKNPPAEDDGVDAVMVLDAPLSRTERLEQAAALVYQTGQPTSEGGALVPPDSWRQLAAALGEE